jgi:TPR repeat protein
MTSIPTSLVDRAGLDGECLAKIISRGLDGADDGELFLEYRQAEALNEEAAAQGSTNAMFNLGTFYDYGRGVAQDYAKAREWYQRAADKGDADARARLEELRIR